MSGDKTTALVTGASSGLGAEFCRQLADRCDVIIAVARRGDRLHRLRDELAGRAELHAIVADLTAIEGVARTMEALRQLGPVDYLVNNAGLGTHGYFSDLPIDGQRDMVSLHIDATMTLCRAAIPFMRERGRGYIINVSSVGAYIPRPHLVVYGATKAFLNHFCLALHDELAGTGIAVQALCAGYTHTEFHLGLEQGGFSKDQVPAELWMEADAVVAASLAALGSGPVIVVPGETNGARARDGCQRQLDALQG